MYADLDRFKLLNDTLGHPAGDAALIHFARIIQGQIRAVDIAARIGGEEFAIWLPKADLEVGSRIAERIRIKLGTTPWDWNGTSLAAQRVVRGRRLSRDRPSAEAAAGAGGRGAVCGQEFGAEPGGAGGEVRAEGRKEGQAKDGKTEGEGGKPGAGGDCQLIAVQWFADSTPVTFPSFRPSILPACPSIFTLRTGATGFDGFVEGMAACPGPESW